MKNISKKFAEQGFLTKEVHRERQEGIFKITQIVFSKYYGCFGIGPFDSIKSEPEMTIRFHIKRESNKVDITYSLERPFMSAYVNMELNMIITDMLKALEESFEGYPDLPESVFEERLYDER